MNIVVYWASPGYQQRTFKRFSAAIAYARKLLGEYAVLDHTCGLSTGVAYRNFSIDGRSNPPDLAQAMVYIRYEGYGL